MDTLTFVATTLVVAAGTLAGYALACHIWPFVACPRCDGTGRKKSPTGKAFRLCRRCTGSGRRLRTGRRIVNYLRVARQDGTR